MKQLTTLSLAIGSLLIVSQVTASESDRKSMHHKHMEERLQQVDSNQDGKIDLEEFLAHSEERFKEIDADGDGFISREEGRDAHKKMREKHKAWRHKRVHDHVEGDGASEPPAE